MPGWLKALLIILIVIVLLVVGVIGLAAFWWMRNKDALISRAKEVITEGRDFGRRSDNQGCVDEGVIRYKKEPGFGTAVSTSLFIRNCLDTSKRTPGFCDDVPRAIDFTKSGSWRTDQCRRVDLAGDVYCPQLFQTVQDYCEKGPQKTVKY